MIKIEHLSPNMKLFEKIRKKNVNHRSQYSNPDYLQHVDTCPSTLTITPRIHNC
jgi:hypothetical protein